MTEDAAWLVAVGCVLFSARMASAFLRHNPRMFTVMALFACVWVLVESYYSAPSEHVLTVLNSNLASFLLVYIGGLLLLEARSSPNHATLTVPLQTFGLVLLLIIVLPKSYSIVFPNGSKFGFTSDQREAIIGWAFDLAGNFSIGFGAASIILSNSKKRLSRRFFFDLLTSGSVLFGILLLILGCYVIMDAMYYYPLIVKDAAEPPLTNFELEVYAVLKAVFTLTLSCIVAADGMTDEDWNKGWIHWILRFLHLN